MKSHRLRILLSAILVLLAFMAPACGDKVPPVNADEVATEAAAAYAAMTTYRADIRMSEAMQGVVNGAQTAIAYFQDMSAVVNKSSQRMQLNMTMGLGKDAASGGMRSYGRAFLVGPHLYTGLSSTTDNFQWSKMDLTDDYWGTSEMMQVQLHLLQSSEREVTGNEKSSGVDCYVFELAPDASQAIAVWDIVYLLGEGTNFPAFKAEWIESTRVTQWIGKDSLLLMESQVEMTLRMAARELDPSAGDGELTITVTGGVVYHDYDQAVSIVVPEEAIT